MEENFFTEKRCKVLLESEDKDKSVQKFFESNHIDISIFFGFYNEVIASNLDKKLGEDDLTFIIKSLFNDKMIAIVEGMQSTENLETLIQEIELDKALISKSKTGEGLTEDETSNAQKIVFLLTFQCLGLSKPVKLNILEIFQKTLGIRVNPAIIDEKVERKALEYLFVTEEEPNKERNNHSNRPEGSKVNSLKELLETNTLNELSKDLLEYFTTPGAEILRDQSDQSQFKEFLQSCMRKAMDKEDGKETPKGESKITASTLNASELNLAKFNDKRKGEGFDNKQLIISEIVDAEKLTEDAEKGNEKNEINNLFESIHLSIQKSSHLQQEEPVPEADKKDLKHKEYIAELNKKFSAEKKELEAAHEKDLEILRQGLVERFLKEKEEVRETREREFLDKLEESRRKWEEDMEALENGHKEALVRKEREAIERITAEFEAQKQHLNKESENIIENIKILHEQEKRELELKFKGEIEKKSEELEFTIKDMENKLAVKYDQDMELQKDLIRKEINKRYVEYDQCWKEEFFKKSGREIDEIKKMHEENLKVNRLQHHDELKRQRESIEKELEKKIEERSEVWKQAWLESEKKLEGFNLQKEKEMREMEEKIKVTLRADIQRGLNEQNEILIEQYRQEIDNENAKIKEQEDEKRREDLKQRLESLKIELEKKFYEEKEQLKKKLVTQLEEAQNAHEDKENQLKNNFDKEFQRQREELRKQYKDIYEKNLESWKEEYKQSYLEKIEEEIFNFFHDIDEQNNNESNKKIQDKDDKILRDSTKILIKSLIVDLEKKFEKKFEKKSLDLQWELEDQKAAMQRTLEKESETKYNKAIEGIAKHRETMIQEVKMQSDQERENLRKEREAWEREKAEKHKELQKELEKRAATSQQEIAKFIEDGNKKIQVLYKNIQASQEEENELEATIKLLKTEKEKWEKYLQNLENQIKVNTSKIKAQEEELRKKYSCSERSYFDQVNCAMFPLTQSGLPDMRYAVNKSMFGGGFGGPLRKDGLPDMRYAANRKYK